MQPLLRQPGVDGCRKLLVADEGRVGIQHVERAGVADRHQRQAVALGQCQDSDVQRVEADRIDRAQLARARAGRRFQLQQFEAELGRDEMGRFVQLGAGAARGAAGVIGELHLATPAPKNTARRFRGRRLDLEECLERIDLAAQQEPDDARHMRQRPQALHAKHQCAGIDPSARGHDVAQRKGMPRHAGKKLRRLCLQRLDDAADDRNAGGADFLALVAGDAIENSGQRQRPLDLLGIVARIERGLPELNQRGRARRSR